MADGRVLHRGQALAGCRVVVGDEATGTVVAHGETGDDGAFHLDADDGLVVAICATDVLGIAATPAAGAPLELELTDVAPTHALTVSVTGSELPDWVQPQVRLMPLGIGDLDDRVLRWITAPVDGLSQRALARMAGRNLTRDVQAGRWWIAAAAFEERAVRAADQPDPRSWTATHAYAADGTALTPMRDGFVLRLDGPLEITLELAG